MARPTLFGHRKLLRLARAVGSRALAIGHLEILWSGAYESGEPVLGDQVDVEGLAEWEGAPGALAQALLDAGGPGRKGFLEVTAEGLLAIHDFWDHAPDYVRRRAEREQKRQDEGKTLSDKRREAALARWSKEPSATATGMQTYATDCHLHATDMQTYATVFPPAPAPAPAQEETTSALAPPTPPTGKPAAAPRRARVSDSGLEGFEEWYAGYPRKKARGDAEKAWKQTAAARPPFSDMIAARNRSVAEWQRQGRPIDKYPYPASYLRDLAFLDGEDKDPAPNPTPRSPDRLSQRAAEALWEKLKVEIEARGDLDPREKSRRQNLVLDLAGSANPTEARLRAAARDGTAPPGHAHTVLTQHARQQEASHGLA